MTEQPTLDQVIEHDLLAVEIPVKLPNTAVIAPGYKEQHSARIEALRAEVAQLPAITDKASYEANQKMRTRLVGIRTGIDKARKAITEPFASLKKQVDGYLGTTKDSGLQSDVRAMEEPIERAQAVWDEQQARVAALAREKIEQRLAARGKRLIDAGAQFDGSHYSLEGFRFPHAGIRDANDEAFDKWFEEKIQPLADAHTRKLAQEAEAKRLKEQAEKEENDRRKAEFERQAAEQKRLDDERAQLDREKAEVRKQKNEMRGAELIALGAERAEDGHYHVGGDLFQVIADLASFPDEEWTMIKRSVTRSVDHLKEQAAAKAQEVVATVVEEVRAEVPTPPNAELQPDDPHDIAALTELYQAARKMNVSFLACRNKLRHPNNVQFITQQMEFFMDNTMFSLADVIDAEMPTTR